MLEIVKEREGGGSFGVPRQEHRAAGDADRSRSSARPRHGGTLGAAVYVAVEHLASGPHAHVDLLVVAPPLEHCGVEQRMLGVALALCEAYDYDTPAGRDSSAIKAGRIRP